ncbi:MAG TPA: mannose-1-phosphate guanylyltransferase [Anaerolineaceae bacterium]|nr:MAG: Mannose-1-phosphate guanylyltransferase [Anaerolineaceae bacterium 46_22]HAF49284.1 mannose-1-phosphate guanylyltransferase [Anaerolineaceae bacterium]
MFEHYYAVIMAGGSGTRLWPLSRRNRSKQSLSFVGDRTMFQHAVDRLQGLFPYERILVVTVAEQVALLKEECPEIPNENYIIEPLPRGTASVVGLAVIAIKHRDPQGAMAILTADHLIKNEAHFRQLLSAAYQLSKESYLVTLGITPTYASTGYGYIQKGEPLGTYGDLQAFQVRRFKEKPDKPTAQQLVSDGQHVWNSGMFIWEVDTVLAEFERQMPDLYQKLEKINESWSTQGGADVLAGVWPTIRKETIDYGIMEGAGKVALIPSVDLGWHDVGSWESLFEALECDDSGNIHLSGDVVTLDTHGTLICEDSADRLIVTIGVEDLIIVDSGNALLVCDRKQTQRVREAVRKLEDDGRDDYL